VTKRTRETQVNAVADSCPVNHGHGKSVVALVDGIVEAGGTLPYPSTPAEASAVPDASRMEIVRMPAWIVEKIQRSYKLVHDAVGRITFIHAGIPTLVDATLEERFDEMPEHRGRLHVTLVTRHRDSGAEIAIEFGDDIPLTISTPEEALDFVYDRARHAWVHELNEALHVDGKRRRDLHIEGTAATINLRITEESDAFSAVSSPTEATGSDG